MKSLTIAAHVPVVLAILLAAISTSPAQEAAAHQNRQLIPLPVYDTPYGEASGAASLKAARVLLSTLDADARSRLMFATDAPERREWSNLPAGMVRRPGISVAEMSDEQRSLLFAFLASSLGEEGYQRVADTMAAEAFLSTDKRAKRLQWDPRNYWISFYGSPSAESSWSWQFGGHHLALNLSVENNRVIGMSPTFVGTEPAVFTLNGVRYEALVDMHLAGYDVFSSLGEEQRRQADAGRVPRDLLAGPGKDGVIPGAAGLSASGMTASQRELLLAAIARWVHIQPEENAVPRMERIAADLDRTSFAWTGTAQVNSPTYMRIQGPSLLIELLSTGGNVGQNASGMGHYHTVYRNPSWEYGGR